MAKTMIKHTPPGGMLGERELFLFVKEVVVKIITRLKSRVKRKKKEKCDDIGSK